MISYILRRLAYAIPTLVGVSLLTFVLFFVVFTPEEMARRNIEARAPSQAQITEWLHQHEYDKPLPQLFEDHMKHLLLFQFGDSDKTRESIWGRIRAGAIPSIELGGLAFGITLGVGLGLSILVAYLRGTYIDTVATGIAVTLMSVSIVVYVVAFQFLFGKELRYGPVGGYEAGVGGLRFMVLPVLVALATGVGNYVRLYRTFLLDETGQDYVRTARAKGLGESTVLFKHVLKNAMIPVITTTVAAIPGLILGNLVLESFFGIPGIGNYLVTAINGQDFSVVRAMVYLGAVLYIVGLILTDILYAIVDPRVRIQ